MIKNIAAADSNPSVEEVIENIIKACGEAKGKDLTLLDVSNVSDVAQYFVIASGRSDRQVQGISNKIIDSLAHLGMQPDSVEGLDQAHWVLMDLGDVVVHVFYEPTRKYYDLEGLWSSARLVEIDDELAGPLAA